MRYMPALNDSSTSPSTSIFSSFSAIHSPCLKNGRGRKRPRDVRSLYYEAIETFLASGPFAPSASSNSTFAPSARDLWPSPLMELKWTNTSLPPASGVMKPYPFASLNHLTVPVAIEKHLLYQVRTG